MASSQPTKKWATIPQIAQEAQIPTSWLYERSRHDALPGQRRLGKYIRINRDEFFAALEKGKLR